jgi:hypothetical protein
LLKRNSFGIGKIKAEKVGKEKIDFHISEDLLTVSAKRDKLQHPFLEQFFEWGNNLTFFPFGSTMGQRSLRPLEIREGIYNINIRDYRDYIGKFIKGKEKYGDKYTNSIIKDMKKIDYDIRNVDLVPVELILPLPIDSKKLFALQITEEDIGIIVEQLSLSQGMFRAFSLIIQLNYLIFEAVKGGTILIDDIGEGLDYDRSNKLIKLIIEKLKGTENQLIMTTNDRFVMNNTPIEYWNILNRKGHIVEVINSENSKSIFNDFYKSGLSNFDFFSSKLYLGESQNN